MKIQKTIAMVLAVMFVLTAFAGCTMFRPESGNGRTADDVLRNDRTDATIAEVFETTTEEEKVIDKTQSKTEAETKKEYEVFKTTHSTWKEIPVKYLNPGESSMTLSLLPFNLKEIVEKTTFVFQGTIVGIKEYEVTWIAENGEPGGPSSSSILYVKINKELYGGSPVGDTIKIYYPFGISEVENDSIYLVEGGEYVFMTRLFDDNYMKWRENKLKEDNAIDVFESHKFADAALSENIKRTLFPIENKTIIMCSKYFNEDSDALKKTVSYVSSKSDKLVSSGPLGKDYIAFEAKNFENEFMKVFINTKNEIKKQAN